MSKIKVNTIHIEGKTWLGCESAEVYMKDMLRYDNGTIFELNQEEGKPGFTATIICTRYTPARWLSFGLCPTLVEGTPEAWRTQMGHNPNSMPLKDVQSWIDNSDNVSMV
jgi:hypothetical protein|tara:strand:- start:105 stop:434 length:330 start_codon:yes stop_codon:yes gene_type:complete